MRRLSEFDEFPRHQIGATFDTVADGSPHWSDGYHFTTGDDEGRWAWFMGLRLHVPAELIRFCRDRLSHYKCPRSVDYVHDLGRNAMGKITKRASRAPCWEPGG